MPETICALSSHKDAARAAQSDAKTQRGVWRIGRSSPRRVSAAILTVTATAALALTAAGPASAAAVTTPAPSTTASVIALDSFNRTTAGLGTADFGGAWTLTGPANVSSLVATSTANGGTVAQSLPKAVGTTATLMASKALDADVALSFSMPKIIAANESAAYIATGARRLADGSGYFAAVALRPAGVATLTIYRVNAGNVQTSLTAITLPFSVAAGKEIHLQESVSGQTISARAWLDGQATPAWQVVVTDPSAAAITSPGAVGFSDYTSGASANAITANFLEFKAYDTAPVVVPSAGAGSQPVGSTAYAIPPGAVFVSTTGNDTTGRGSITLPYLSVKTALAHAAAGTTIVLRGGLYNQSTTIPATKNDITIQSYPNEAVWFDGSIPVSGWVKSGAAWVHAGWTAQFDHSGSFTTGSEAGGFVNPAYPLAAYPDQVFFEGAQLTQVKAAPGAGQFAVNYSAHSVTVGSDPSAHAVRASNLAQAFVIAGARITLRGFGVRNYATPLPNIGAIYQGGDIGHDTFENLVITNNATIGLSTRSPGNVINHVSANANGYSGLQISGAGKGVAADGEIIQYSQINGNNTQRFNPGPACAGIKVDKVLSGIKVINNEFTGNIGTNAIWLDENVTNFVVAGNMITGDQTVGTGIIAELSDTGIIANNTISNMKYGVTIYNSGNIRIYNNKLSGMTTWNIGLTQDGRWRKSTAGPNVQPSAAAPWLVQNITAANNVISSAKAFQIYVLDKQTNRPASSMNLMFSGNLFSAHNSSSDSVMVGWGGGDNTTVTYLNTPAALNAALGTTWRNTQESVSGVTVLQMAINARSMINAVALPADVAATSYVAAGTTRIGTLY